MMTDSIRTVLSPLFTISYVFGGKIIRFPASESRPWFGILYLLLLWSIYYFLLTYTVIHYVIKSSITYHFCIRLEMFTGTLSTFLGLYYDKELKNCLRKLAMVDSTLEKVGITTDYQKLYTKVLLVALGWFLSVTWRTYIFGVWYSDRCGPMEAIYVAFMLDYFSFVNLIDDLIIASILGYIELKFDQVNEYLQKWKEENKHDIRRIWKNLVLLPHQTVYSRSKSSECITWIIIHLHLELRRISRDLNSIFGLQMTVKIGTYFAFITLSFRGIFNIVFVNNYVTRPMLFFFAMVTCLMMSIYRLFLINYMCERVNIKANAAGDLIHRILYYSSDIVARENILQLILQLTQAPVRFYGLRLFQFGFKFLYGFFSSVATVIVILVQSHTNKHTGK